MKGSQKPTGRVIPQGSEEARKSLADFDEVAMEPKWLVEWKRKASQREEDPPKRRLSLGGEAAAKQA
jgi:hypothetical protein